MRAQSPCRNGYKGTRSRYKIEVHIGASPDCTGQSRSAGTGIATNMTPPKDDRGQGKHIGPTMELEPLLLDLAPGHATSSGGTYRNLGGTPFLFDKDATDAAKATDSERISKIQQLVGPSAQRLVEIYQTTIEPSLPVVGAAPPTSSEMASLNTWNPTLLATMCTVSEPWLSEAEPSTYPTSALSSSLDDLAFSFFSGTLSRPALSTIQSGLLLMQRPNIDTKTLHTQLVDAAYELGLQLNCATWSISTAEMHLRKRLSWALYMQDKWCALVHGRPPAISRANWIVQPLAASDFATHGDAALELGRDIFTQLAGLTEILALVLDTFYTPQAMDEAAAQGTLLVLERAKPAQIRLKDWFAALPAHLKLDAASPPSSLGHLHLLYFATEITLHRSILRSLANPSSTTDPYIAYICRAAAKTRLISAMDFVNRLRPEHWAAFWYFPSRTAFALVGTFGGLLRATAPGQEEAEFYATRLREYRWTLGVSARKAPWLNPAVESLDAGEALLVNLPIKPTTGEMGRARGEGATEGKARMGEVEGADEEKEEEESEEGDVEMTDGGSEESDETEEG